MNNNITNMNNIGQGYNTPVWLDKGELGSLILNCYIHIVVCYVLDVRFKATVTYAPLKMCFVGDPWPFFPFYVVLEQVRSQIVGRFSLTHTHTVTFAKCFVLPITEECWPWVAVEAHCWGGSTLRWFPCFYGWPSGPLSSVWTAAWGRNLTTFIRFFMNKDILNFWASSLCFYIIKHIRMVFKDGIKCLEVKLINSKTGGCGTQRQWPARDLTKVQGFYINQAAKASSHHCHFLLRWLTDRLRSVWSIRSQKHIC